MAMILVHPNLYSVGCLDGSSGQWVDPDEVEMANGFVLMPPSIAPSMESLDDDGLYLLDGGLRIYLYIGASVAEHVRNDLLDDSTPSDLKNQIESLVYQMRAYSSSNRGSENEFRPTWVPVIRVLQQDGHQSPQEAEILNLMVADVSAGEKDYVDFLCTLHRGIRDQVEGGKK
jgi:protein transport protein SEC24